LGSLFSLSSLACALCIAIAFIAARLHRRQRRIRLKVILRALFPRRIASHSTGIDFSYLVFNTFIFGAMFSWAVLSFGLFSNGAIGVLTSAFGRPAAAALPEFAMRALLTAVLFLAYEFGYWLQHYLCHRVPFLWEFHKVHHTANVLTPLTVFRIHPLDGVIFSNILAVTLGLTNGAASYLFGKSIALFSIDDANIILVLFVHIYVHLQHTHLWIAFTGLAGRIFLSPAHHQIHHSNNPVHFDKNLGSCLAIYDWLFGTLHVPAKEPEPLSFGVKVGEADMHSLGELYVAPVQRAAAHVVQSMRGEGAPIPETPPVSR
jgi:sterol desaturase/sphingolipid hydroxylase (fatty acid hydroxylase superfamily)